jgi:hypothetical protein
MMEIKAGDYYKHYEGDVYKIIPPPKDEWTGRPIIEKHDREYIWYIDIEGQVWCIHYDKFVDKVYIDEKWINRFNKLTPHNLRWA